MKEYAKQVEEQTNKEKIKMHSEVQKEKESIKTERDRSERCSRRIEDQGRVIFNSRSRNKDKKKIN